MTRRIRNLGILAHVDAGKTTVTENMLFLSGAIRAVGNVDKGTSLSDGLEVERRRGISVRATTLSFTWQDVQINLIDTPGHVDFAAEVERSLRILDCAILVVSAVEGIQSHTQTIWKALESLHLPVILFVNKLDRVGADTESVVADLRRRFSADMALVNQPVASGTPEAAVSALDENGNLVLAETVAAKDDLLLESYLSDESLSFQDLHGTLVDCVPQRELFPVFCGVAKSGVGIEALLDGVVSYFPDAQTQVDAAPSGLVFRLDHDAKLGRVAGVRLFAGRLSNRDTVQNVTANRVEKVTQIKKSVGKRYEDAGVLNAGDIGFIFGMPDVQIGEVLGDAGPVPGNYELSEPLLSVRAIPQDESDHGRLAQALQQLSSEDPHLNFTWFDEERELHVKIMGTIQTEILTELLDTRFGIQARFDDPTVLYKETPASTGDGIERYTMPKPCWAIVKYRLEPGERGSGVCYSSEVSVDDIKAKYQSEIESSIPGALKQGIKGWEVTDLKITLIEGSDHVLHSRPGNFKLATNIAVLKGLTETDTILLEPILFFRIEAPESFIGKIASEIVNGRGIVEPAQTEHGQVVVSGRIPLATSMDFPIRLNSMTGGTAKYTFHYGGYEPCPQGEGTSREYKGISPLDRSKYILKMRGAIKEAM